jgi:methyltransferase (TIGR00027 family)
MTHAVNLDAVGRTALVTAALRAAETDRPDAIYRDPYAATLAGELGARLAADLLAAVAASSPADAPSSARETGARDYNAIRTRYFDDYLQAAAQEPGMRQIVVVGAGMDSRAYRLRWPDHVRYFEVDRGPVLAYKRECLAAVTPGADLHSVPADLASPSWASALTEAGYEPGQPSAWLLEGLLFYLPESGVHRVLDEVAGLVAPGSRIAADVVNCAGLTLPGVRGLLDVFASWGCPWLFGCDEPEALFDAHGFKATALQPGDPGAEYGRWPDPVPPRDRLDVRRVFLVTGHRH